MTFVVLRNGEARTRVAVVTEIVLMIACRAGLLLSLSLSIGINVADEMVVMKTTQRGRQREHDADSNGDRFHETTISERFTQ